MKLPLLLTLTMAAPVLAGTPVMESRTQVVPMAPAEPSTPRWFLGASAGYLDEFDEPIYHAQLGMTTPWTMSGWKSSIFLEGGWTETDANTPSLQLLGDDEHEFEIIPVTLNIKFDRALTGNFGLYLGAGAGVAFTDYNIDFAGGGNFSEEEESFYGQVFAGVSFHATQQLELFAGARWVYLDYDSPTGTGADSTIDFGDDDFLGEVGLRVSF